MVTIARHAFWPLFVAQNVVSNFAGLMSPTSPSAVAPDPSAEANDRWREVRFRHSPSFLDVLREARCSLLVSTYQAGKLLSIGLADGKLHFSFHNFDQAMGVAV